MHTQTHTPDRGVPNPVYPYASKLIADEQRAHLTPPRKAPEPVKTCTLYLTPRDEGFA